MCTPVTLTLELHHNSRVTAGLLAKEDYFTDDYGFAVRPGHFPGKDIIDVTLAGLDLGRFDSEGDAYLCDFLNIVPGDLIGWEVEA
tara:strand:+ start:3640 stop:3897 length:258 start_codon:yes stop_codon:yes gene_type:complete